MCLFFFFLKKSFLFITVIFIYFYREPFESDSSAQTDVGAGSLRDDGSAAAGGSGVETSRPADVTGGEQQLNTGWEPNDSVRLSQSLCSVGVTYLVLLLLTAKANMIKTPWLTI